MRRGLRLEVETGGQREELRADSVVEQRRRSEPRARVFPRASRSQTVPLVQAIGGCRRCPSDTTRVVVQRCRTTLLPTFTG